MDPNPSRKGVVMTICVGVLAMGMIAGAGLWMTASFTVAAVVMLGHWVAMQWSVSVSAVREGLPAEIAGQSRDLELAVGSKLPMIVALTNHGKLPIAWLLAEDLLPTRGLTCLAPRLSVMTLWPGQTKRLEYEVQCGRRGYFQIGPTVLETGDPVGMFRRYRLGARPIYLTVLPKVQWLSTYEIGSRRPIGEIRIRDSAMTDPTRLRGIRQWQIGDPMRSVHWAATARTGTLHSKIYEPSSIIGATLILDLHQSTNPDRHEPVRVDLAIAAAASIAAALHDAGEPFGLATNGRDAADRIRTEGFQGDHRVRDDVNHAAAMREQSDRLRPVLVPVDRGPVQLKQLTATLARLERTDGLTLAEFLVESQSSISHETTLMFIVQKSTPEDIAAMIGLSRRGYAVAVIVNTLDISDYSAIAGPLIAERIPVSHLASEQSILDVCRAQLQR